MASNTAQKRNNPFSRTGSPSPAPGHSNGRPKSMMGSSPLSGNHSPPPTQGQGHSRSYSSLAGLVSPNPTTASRHRSNSKSAAPSSNTFAPSFIKTEETRREHEVVNGIEGENDFSGKRYVWLKDPQTAFVKGWIVEELAGQKILVQCDDGSVSLPRTYPRNNANLLLATRSQCRQCRQSQSRQIR